RDFGGGAFPVLEAEGIKREKIRPAALLAQTGALGDDSANGLGAFLMPANALQPASHRPATVAVHNDGNVAGNAFVGDVFQGCHNRIHAMRHSLYDVKFRKSISRSVPNASRATSSENCKRM